MKKHVLFTFLLFASIAVFAATTRLQVIVQDAEQNPVEGAEVILYDSETDYRANKNAIDTVLTDKKGRARFSDLQPKSYYMDVRKGELSNVGYDAQTEVLSEGKLNRVLVELN